MMFKKLLAVVVCVILIASFTACDSDSVTDTQTPQDGTGAVTDQTNKPSEKQVNLTFMGWEASPLETEAVENGINEFEKQFPNIKVSYTPGLAGSEYNAKLLSSAAAGTMPDVMYMMAEAYQAFVSKNALYDITNKFDETYPFDDFIESSKTIMKLDGRIYGISSCTVSPIVYYNKDIFDRLDVSYPNSDPDNCWTIDEFREIAKRLTVDDTYGVYGLETVADTLNAQIISNGGTRFNSDYTQSTMNTPEVKEVLETIKAIRVEDGSAPDATTLDAVGMTATQMLQTGKVAMLVDGSWALQELAASGMNIGMAPLPSYGQAITTGQAHLHSIAAGSSHKEEAWEFLKFLSGMDYQGALVSTGLWMPNRLPMYEEDAVAQWYDDDVHGDSYKPMLDYFLNAAVDPSALQKSSQIRDILIEETDMYFKEDQDIDVTLENLDRRINAAIQEAIGE